MTKRNVIILGAAGRDFHNFNTYYRDNENYNVVAFTAAQIPDIEDRRYPPELAGKLYPKGIPIYAEGELPRLIKDLKADECTFAYSDVTYQHVMSVSAIVEAAGASFVLLGPKDTQIKSSKPVISVSKSAPVCCSVNCATVAEVAMALLMVSPAGSSIKTKLDLTQRLEIFLVSQFPL